MRSIRLFLISVIFLVGLLQCVPASACWGPWDYPSGYYLLRIYNPESDQVKDNVEKYRENLLAWQAITSKDIHLEDIYEAVYKCSLDELGEDGWDYYWERLTVKWDNRSLSWVAGHEDKDIANLLILTRRSENLRSKMNSPWYYPSHSDGIYRTLDDIAEEAMEYSGSRLIDRYALQAIRAMFANGQYKECLDYWDWISDDIPEGYVRRQIEGYISGCCLRTGRGDEAMTRFAKAGDVESVRYCSKHLNLDMDIVDIMEYTYDRCSRCDGFDKIIQDLDRGWETYREWTDMYDMDLLKKLHRFSLKVAGQRKTGDEARWYYLASYLSAYFGDLDEASRLCSLAEKSRGDEFIKESVHVMRFWIDVQRLPVGQSYDNYMYSQLRWLCAKVKDNFGIEEAYGTLRATDLQANDSYYYYNDMLRRIVLGTACPRLIEEGRGVRALQLANMADNYIYQVADDFVTRNGYTWETKQAERKGSGWKSTDFSNNFFEMIDSLGVDTAIAYGKVLMHPVSQFDAFLSERSYRDPDYINDIMGTQCLRYMRYQEAKKYLGRVSTGYQERLNVKKYLRYDPFSYGYQKIDMDAAYIKDRTDYKYKFAKEMASLERDAKSLSDVNRRCRAKALLARGMENSVGDCWALTQYYKGEMYYFSQAAKRNWEEEKPTKDLLERSRQLSVEAAKEGTDKDYMVGLFMDLGRWDLVGKYVVPNPKERSGYRSKCDSWKDYMEANLSKYRN